MEVLRRSYVNIFRRWRRNLLTVSAVTIGIAALTGLVSVSYSSATHTVSAISSLKSDVLKIILPTQTWDMAETEIQQLLKDIDGIEGGGTFVSSEDFKHPLTITNIFNTNTVETKITIASPESMKNQDIVLVEGTYPNTFAETSSIVLGRKIAENLGINFSTGNTNVVIKGTLFKVLGVAEGSGEYAAASITAILSPQVAHSFFEIDIQRSVIVRVEPTQIDSIMQKVRHTFRSDTGEEPAFIYPPSPDELRAQLLQNTSQTVIALSVILALMTAFIVINTMQTAVTERRAEIGLLKALGATETEVAKGFLYETFLLTAIGALLGLLFGSTIGYITAQFSAWEFVLPNFVILFPVGATILGSLAGIWPAYLASKILPLELLR